MARIRIGREQSESTLQTLNEGDVLSILAGGTLARSGAAPAVRIANGVNSATVNNAGTISVTGANGAAIQGALGTALDVQITNAPTGRIAGQSRAIELTSAAGSTGTVRLSNAGTIDGANGIGIDFDSLRATQIVVNNRAGGLITNAGANDVLRPGNDAVTAIRVENAGTIRAGVVDGASSNGDAIDLQPTDGGQGDVAITNRATGLIEGGKHGITGGNAAVIRNEEGGRIIGRNGSGINFDTEVGDGDGAVVVRNAGLISGRYDGYGDGDGDGVDVDYVVDIVNTGRIEGAGADNIDDFGDGIAAGGGRILNASDEAVIFGETHGILIDDGDRNGAYAATLIDNDGTIYANLGTAVRLIGDFDDQLVNNGTVYTMSGQFAVEMGGGDDVVRNFGTITGDVALGDGDDVYRNYGNEGVVNGVVDGGAGADRLFGSDAADVLAGGLGRDVLTGGDGADIFLFRSVAESTFGGSDRIIDLTQDDLIDLSPIDADTTVGGDQAFTLVDGTAFTRRAGELLVVDDGALTRVFGDVDGNGRADLVIVLANGADLLGDNFIL